MPGLLCAFYIDEHSNKVTPVMLHRAMFGSMERFIGILIEHYAGHFPLWLAPVQAVVASIVGEAAPYAEAVARELAGAGLRVVTDTGNETINYKVREHSLAKVPLMLVVGGRAQRSARNGRRCRPRPGRGGAQCRPAGLQDPRFRQVQIRRAKEEKRSSQKAEDHRGQGNQIAPEHR